ncbi:MAG: glycoside hydrolase family 9 protein [Oscillospiraceae bacterium]|nr:glycoside hydrolase family 9 protein [Oscillospiraceae bacterium]
MKQKKSILKAGLCVCLSALVTSTSMFTAFATAGEDPGTVDDSEKVFPDPDSFSYDDVEVNFAKGMQYTMHFYDANKCGTRTGRLEWRADCHMEDAAVPLQTIDPENKQFKGVNVSEDFIKENLSILDPDGDGCIDCEGGMHDAGDHVKFGLPGSYAASTLGWGYYEFRESYEKTGNQEHIEEILRNFCDFYLKGTYYNEDGSLLAFVYQVGEGNIDHNYWICPDLQGEHLLDFQRPAYLATTETPASDMCAGTAAALAINYLNFKDTDAPYAEECLKAAYALYDFAVETHEEDPEDCATVLSLGYDGGFYDSSYDYDELAWAAVWLYICTVDKDATKQEEAYDKYINAIISVDESVTYDNGGHPYTGYFRRIMKDTNNCWNNIWVHCWDTVWGGVFAKLAPITNIERDWYIFRWNCEFWSGITHLDPGLVDTIWNQPFEWDNQPPKPEATDYLKTTPAGFSMLNEYGSARYNTAAELCCLVYAKYSEEKKNDPMRFAEWAEGQMEYIMGKNPMNRPYIVGWSPTAASHPHHRASHGSKDLNMDHPADQVHVLWGALVGGPDAGDWHRDITKDYVYNEVAVDYNAAVVGACAGLYYFYGDETMKNQENFPPAEATMKSSEELQEFSLKAAVGQEDNMATQVLITFTNDTLLPPRYLDEVKIRYYFDISELLAAGHTVDDITVRPDYDKMASDSNKEHEVTYEVVQYNDKGGCYLEMTWSDYKFYGELGYQFAIMDQKQNDEFVFVFDPTNDYSREGMVTEEELGKPLNECPEIFDKITMYVEGKHVWGTPPSDCPDPEWLVTDSDEPSTKNNYGDVNCDGDIDVSDAVLLCRYLAEDSTAKVSTQGKQNADCVLDSVLNNDDTVRILQYIAKLIPLSKLGTK